MNSPIDRQMNDIPVPETLHSRCAQGVARAKAEQTQHREETTMNMRFGKKAAAAAIALVLSLGVLAGGTVAMADSDEGFFRDLFRGTAVVGTEYANATEEVSITAGAEEGAVTLELRVDDAKAPWKYVDSLALGDYVIRSNSGTTVRKSDDSQPSGTLHNGEAVISVPAGDLAPGAYTMELETLYGLAKAESPLLITGGWTVAFTVE